MRALESFLPQIQRTWGDLNLGGARLLALGELVVWGKKHGCRYGRAESGRCLEWVPVCMLNPDGPSGQCRDSASKQKF